MCLIVSQHLVVKFLLYYLIKINTLSGLWSSVDLYINPNGCTVLNRSRKCSSLKYYLVTLSKSSSRANLVHLESIFKLNVILKLVL